MTVLVRLRARWRTCRLRLWHWLTDGMYPAHLVDSPTEGAWSWRWRGWVETAGVWLLCRAGHEPTRDHCNKPEHDHCLFCHRLMPGAVAR